MARVSVGEVGVYPGGGTSPASVTGSPPQWDDESDATYATTSANLSLGSQYVGGDLTPDGAVTSTDLVMYVRFKMDAGNTGTAAKVLHVHWFIGETDAGATSISVDTLGVIEDQTVPLAADDFDPDTPYTDFLEALNDGTASVRVLAGSPSSVGPTNTAIIYELWLGASVGCANPYRAYQESDPSQGGIWADDSDATYTEQWGDGGPFDGFPNYAGGLLAPYSDDPTKVTGIQVTVRASATRTDGLSDPVMVQYDLYSGSASDPLGSTGSVDLGTSSQDFPITADGTIRDYIWSLSADAVAANSYGADKPYPGDFTFADIAWMMTQPTPAIEFYFDSWGGTPFDPVNRVVRIYQVRVCLLTVQPVLRLYPRDDALGMSTTPRLFPPPKARRVIGGYQ